MIGIYKIENLITHQCYIGQSKFIERRWQEHRNRLNIGTSKLYQALREYGIDNFSWEIIEECSQNELDEREIYWIQFYNSFNDGYNSTLGGRFQSTINVEDIYAAWDSGLSNKQIAEKFNISTSIVYEILVRYKNYTKHEVKVRGGRLAAINNSNNAYNGLDNIVFRYDLDGKYLDAWHSIKEASKTLGISSDSIRRALNGKYNKAGGFMWSREQKENIGVCPTKNAGVAIKVQKFDLNDNFIEEYESYSAAARSVNKTDTALIRRVVNKPNKTAYGFKWKN